jgi:hypothetical protein
MSVGAVAAYRSRVIDSCELDRRHASPRPQGPRVRLEASARSRAEAFQDKGERVLKNCAKPQEVAETVSVAASENDEGLKEHDACFDSLAPSSQEVYELATTISQAEAFLRANEHYNAPASSDGGEPKMNEEAMGTLAG